MQSTCLSETGDSTQKRRLTSPTASPSRHATPQDVSTGNDGVQNSDYDLRLHSASTLCAARRKRRGARAMSGERCCREIQDQLTLRGNTFFFFFFFLADCTRSLSPQIYCSYLNNLNVEHKCINLVYPFLGRQVVKPFHPRLLKQWIKAVRSYQ